MHSLDRSLFTLSLASSFSICLYLSMSFSTQPISASFFVSFELRALSPICPFLVCLLLAGGLKGQMPPLTPSPAGAAISLLPAHLVDVSPFLHHHHHHHQHPHHAHYPLHMSPLHRSSSTGSLGGLASGGSVTSGVGGGGGGGGIGGSNGASHHAMSYHNMFTPSREPGTMWRCRSCGKEVTNRWHHYHSHTAQRSMCPYCPATYSRIDTLRSHLRAKHSDQLIKH